MDISPIQKLYLYYNPNHSERDRHVATGRPKDVDSIRDSSSQVVAVFVDQVW